MNPAEFISSLSSISMPNVFNPWAQKCEIADKIDSVDIRKRNLQMTLERALDLKVDSIWIGRDLGYMGGRRTGLALTDEANLGRFSKLYGGLPLDRATFGPLAAERTAAMVWETISNLNVPIFTWNVFPLHPHAPGKPMTNRCHKRGERRQTFDLLQALIGMIEPKVIVALGNDAASGLEELGVSSIKVRHPSYGGKADFVTGVAKLYGVKANELSQPKLI
ncbi:MULTISPECIES: uracil-DNA glycosylase [unclassified Sphingopyxis]|uniref:uracil-DNA glycosylase n=1 Tax=unclassified Sphingopyxis TaxID=2614943 RepID=UPI0009EA2CC6|nr:MULTISPECIES: uracil-DNA glycosylase [unclassified Sphingopyxis]